jgi:antibiotic biosynthesis monooxygenase (ABM) superfamily enzyme
VSGPPVTVVARRRVRRGREAAYEAWLSRFLADAAGEPGFLGAEVIRPADGAPERVYTSIFRFTDPDTLAAFEGGALRARHLAEAVELVEADAVWERMTGLELWFTPPPGTVVAQPSRARMALLLIVVVYGLVLSIGAGVGALLDGWPYALRLLVTITVEVVVMTWIVMPWLTRRLARWLYPSTRTV